MAALVTALQQRLVAQEVKMQEFRNELQQIIGGLEQMVAPQAAIFEPKVPQ